MFVSEYTYCPTSVTHLLGGQVQPGKSHEGAVSACTAAPTGLQVHVLGPGERATDIHSPVPVEGQLCNLTRKHCWDNQHLVAYNVWGVTQKWGSGIKPPCGAGFEVRWADIGFCLADTVWTPFCRFGCRNSEFICCRMVWHSFLSALVVLFTASMWH